MDTFDLRWPHGTATLCTDGWRCRIVWRGVRGLGGSIENSALAKRRVADGLVFAPQLLHQLRSRGHGELAEEIELLLPKMEVESAVREQATAPASSSSTADVAETNAPTETVAERADDPEEPVEAQVPEAVAASSGDWIEALPGDGAWQSCGNRRAKTWIETVSGTFVKLPLKKGPREWVVKSVVGKKVEYAAATTLKGVLRYVEHQGIEPDEFMAHADALAKTKDAEVDEVMSAWKAGHPEH